MGGGRATGAIESVWMVRGWCMDTRYGFPTRVHFDVDVIVCNAVWTWDVADLF